MGAAWPAIQTASLEVIETLATPACHLPASAADDVWSNRAARSRLTQCRTIIEIAILYFSQATHSDTLGSGIPQKKLTVNLFLDRSFVICRYCSLGIHQQMRLLKSSPSLSPFMVAMRSASLRQGERPTNGSDEGGFQPAALSRSTLVVRNRSD